MFSARYKLNFYVLFTWKLVLEVVCRWLFVVESRIRSRLCPCEVGDGQSGAGTSFVRVLRLFPVSIIPHILHTLQPNTAVIKTCGRSLRTFKRSNGQKSNLLPHQCQNFVFAAWCFKIQWYCFRYDPTTKRQSAEWRSPASPKGKKVRLQKSKVKKMHLCFYGRKGIFHHEFIPEGQSVTGIFYLSVLERLSKRNRRVRPEYSAPRQLVSSSRQCTGSPGSCYTRIFSPKTSVRAPSSVLLPWFIPLWLFSVPQTEVIIERAPVWRCSRHPSSCDIESSGHTTRRRAEVLPVFARSCHSLYRCRSDVLWIKCR